MPKCLIIDDVEVTRFSTTQFLKELGVDSSSVEGVPQALASLQGSAYDAVLLDWHLGKDSGLDLLKTIRSQHSRTIPVIIISGVEKREAATQAIDAGANGFLEKPTTKEKLQNSLKSIGLLK